MANIQRGERIRTTVALDYVVAPLVHGKEILETAGYAIPTLYSSAAFCFSGGENSSIFKESHHVRDSILVIPKHPEYLDRQGIYLTKIPLVFDNIKAAAKEHGKHIPQEYSLGRDQVEKALENSFCITGRDEVPILTITPSADEISLFAYEKMRDSYLSMVRKCGGKDGREIKVDLFDLPSRLNSSNQPFARAVVMHGSRRGFKISADGKNAHAEARLKGFKFAR